MPFSVDVDVRAVDQIRARAEAERSKIPPELRTMLGRAGLLVVRYARQNLVPGHGRRTGALANSISVKLAGDTARVGPTVHYGGFVEFGTGRRGASSGVQPWVKGYRYGTVAGMSARPYLRPGWVSAKPEVQKMLADVAHGSARRLGGHT